MYIRFLLPMLPWLFALAGVTGAWACRRLPVNLSGAAVLGLALVIAIWGVGRARGVGTFRLQASEARYVHVADVVRASPPGAVVLAMQHSGSLTYHTGRPVLRWDWIETAEIETTLATLARLGRPVYVVLEDWEEPQVRARFGGTTLAALPAPVFTAGVEGGIQVRVYPLLRSAALATADAGPLPSPRVASPPPEFASAGAGGRGRP
jgi:hypothetical protein